MALPPFNLIHASVFDQTFNFVYLHRLLNYFSIFSLSSSLLSSHLPSYPLLPLDSSFWVSSLLLLPLPFHLESLFISSRPAPPVTVAGRLLHFFNNEQVSQTFKENPHFHSLLPNISQSFPWFKSHSFQN